MEQPSYLALVIGAVFVNNMVLSTILGICPLLGVSKSLKTAFGMASAVLFVLTLSTLVTSAIFRYVLLPGGLLKADLTYMRTLVFILVIAALVQFVELVLLKFSQPLYKALGIYLPLITTNCAVLGAAVICADKNYSVLRATVFGAASAAGFGLALLMFASMREKIELAKVPECMKGTAIALVTVGILAMAFMGFAGLGG